MKLLLDTATVIRIAIDETKLSKVASEAYRAESNTPFISVVSIWEILVKNRLGKLPLPMQLQDLLAPLRVAGIATLPLTESAIYRVAQLPDIHRDPFDRMLICQAIDEDMTIVTPDRLMTSYPVKTLW
jgi:PIN domain nuclease of toxin-antitoxin system